MRRTLYIPLLVALGLLLLASASQATVGGAYTFTASSGTYTQISTGTQVIGPTPSGTSTGTYNDLATSGVQDIGFRFTFDCTTYTTFSVNTNGLIILGGPESGSFTNNLTSAPAYPIIAPLWQHQSTLDGTTQANACSPPVNTGVSYTLTGASPN